VEFKARHVCLSALLRGSAIVSHKDLRQPMTMLQSGDYATTQPQDDPVLNEVNIEYVLVATHRIV
jgi:hypothetical protein